MGIFFNENTLSMISVQEAYFGKAKCKKIEAAIAEARKPYIGHKFGGGMNYYSDPNFIEVGKAIKDVFGFNLVDFNIDPDSALNAYTYSLSRSLTGANVRAKVVNGMINYKDQSYANMVVRCSSGLWASDRFSDAEITAIILHEIGHNFSNNVSTQLQSYNLLLSFVQIINICGGNISALLYDPSIKSAISDAIKHSPWLSLFAGGIKSINAIIKYVIYVCISGVDYFGIMNLLSVGINWIANPLGSIVSTIFGTYDKGEEFSSDKFAASCGYGSELASALTKLDLSNNPLGTNIEKVINNIPVLGHVHNFMSIPVSICLSPFASHPITPKRVNNIISELEKELKKDKSLSPEMKKEIRKNIEDTKKAVEDYTAPKGDSLDINRRWFANFVKRGKSAGPVTGNIASHDMLDESAIMEELSDISKSDISNVRTLVDNAMQVLESLDISSEYDCGSMFGWDF